MQRILRQLRKASAHQTSKSPAMAKAAKPVAAVHVAADIVLMIMTELLCADHCDFKTHPNL